MAKKKTYGIEEFRSALHTWATDNETDQFYVPSTLRFGSMKVSAGQYTFKLAWKGVEILSGYIPGTDDLRNKSRVWYVCTLVQAAIERIKTETYKPL
jgi:hypothetical protein